MGNRDDVLTQPFLSGKYLWLGVVIFSFIFILLPLIAGV